MSSEKTVVVVGGGFAGYTLIRRLRKMPKRPRIILVDPRRQAVFLPLLPDVVAGKVRAERLLFSLEEFCRKNRIEFRNRSAVKLPNEHTLLLDDGENLSFDFLALAGGMEPNFYGNEAARAAAFTLASIEDALALRRRILEVADAAKPHTFLVVGGGYTGVETASALAYAARKLKKSGIRVRIAELSPRILGNLPEGIAGPVRREIARMGIEVTAPARLEVTGSDEVRLNDEILNGITLVWSAGMQAIGFVRELNFEKDRQGRLRVEPDLSLPGAEHIFAVGDCAWFQGKAGPLRAAVQFSWAEGTVVGENIVRKMTGLPSRPHRPRDYGYLVPVASGRAWGKVLGRRVGGRAGACLHYLLCVHRTLDKRNRIGLIRDLLV